MASNPALNYQITGDASPFQASVEQARRAVSQFDKAIAQMAATANSAGGQMVRAANDEVAAFRRMNAEIGGGKKALDGHAASSGHASAQLQALMHSARSITEQLTLGVSPMQAFTGQLSHLSYVASAPGGLKGALGSVGELVTGTVTKFPLATAAIVATAAGFLGLQHEINETAKVHVSFGNTVMATFDVIRDGIYNEIRPAFQELAPYVSGIWSEIVSAFKYGINDAVAHVVGGVRFIEAAWSNLPAVMGDLSVRAGNAFLDGLRRMIQAAVVDINVFIHQMQAAARGTPLEGLANSMPMLNNSFGKNGPFNKSLWQIDNPYAGAADKASAAFNDAFKTDYAGQFFDSVSKKAQELAAAAKDAGGAMKNAAKGAKDPWEGLRKVTKQTKDELADFEQSTFKGFLSTLRSDLQQGQGLWKSFGDASLNVLDKIADKADDELASALFSSSTTGLGGLVGSIFSWLGFAKGAAFDNGQVTPFARGGIVTRPTLFPMAKGAGLMGEAGPEGILPLRRSSSGHLGVIATGVGQSSAQQVHVSVGVTVDSKGELKAYVKSVARDEGGRAAQAGIARYNDALPGRIRDVMERNG